MAKEAGINENAMLTITAAEKASRSYEIQGLFSEFLLKD